VAKCELTNERGDKFPPEHYDEFGFLGVVAHAKLKPTDSTFKFLNWQATDDGSNILEGAPTRIVTRGKHIGRTKFNGRKQIIVVTESERKAAELDYERSTGKCSSCIGSGRKFAKWDHITGVWFRVCSECAGSGLSSAASKP
jgi:hypothetical protein